MNTLFKYILRGCALMLCGAVVSCSDEANPSYPISLSSVTSLSDFATPLKSASLGDFIAIHGTGLDKANIDSILINDVHVDLGEIYTENDVLYMQIPVQLAVNITDMIYIYNGTGVQKIPFHTETPDLRLDNMFNEYTAPGDTITIYGDFFNLYQISQETAVVLFGDKEGEVTASGNNYIRAAVPLDAEPNVQVRLRSNIFNVEATCPGRYYDRRCVLCDYDEHPSTNMDNVVTDPSDPERLSGNFMRIDQNSTWSGWWYISETWPTAITDDMLDHPENYVIKCEFRTGNQFIQDRIGFYVYLFWDAAPITWTADLFNVQNFNRWQTISLPLVVNRSSTYTDNSYYNSFNIRLECYEDLARNFAFDNFRICPKND